MYFTHWITLSLEQPHPRHTSINETHARWIFALLSRVEDYVSADDMHLLRNLIRACLELLKDTIQNAKQAASSVSSETMSVRSCWIIITIVVDHWAQRDLWMDAEEMFAKVEMP